MVGNEDGWSPVEMDRALANVRDAYRRFAEGFPGGRSESEGDLLLIDSGTMLAELNVAFLTGRAAGLEKRVKRAVQYYTERGLPWRLAAGEDLRKPVAKLAIAAGLSEEEHRPGLLCRAPFEGLARPPPGATVRRVRSPMEAMTFAHVVTTGSGFEAPPEIFDVPFHQLDDVRCYIAYVGETPAACSMLHLQGGFAGVYAVATIESFRRRGLARAVTSESLRDALVEGYRASCLQASPMGLPIYLEMGYIPAFDEYEWTAPAKAAPKAPAARSKRR